MELPDPLRSSDLAVMRGGRVGMPSARSVVKRASGMMPEPKEVDWLYEDVDQSVTAEDRLDCPIRPPPLCVGKKVNDSCGEGRAGACREAGELEAEPCSAEAGCDTMDALSLLFL